MPLTDPRVLALVCDACHRGLPGVTAEPDAWAVMWRVAVDRGWSGPADSGGPHRCPTCGHATTHPAAASPPARLLAHLAAVGAAAVVRLTGDLDASKTEDLRAVLRHAMADHTHLVLDLQGVRLIDSTALGALVRAHLLLKSHGGTVCLVAASQFVRVVLHTMHLETVFLTFETVGAALDGLTGTTLMR